MTDDLKAPGALSLGGIPVDRFGGPTVDPTKNVLDLVQAAVKRIDDLNAASAAHAREMMKLEMRRQDDLREAEARRVEEHIRLTDEFHGHLSQAEKSRLDAIRAVDVNAMGIASERAAAAANVLQNQVTQTAESHRALIEQTAATIAQQFAQTTTALTDRLASLEKAQYEGQGRAGIANPVLDEKFNALARLLTDQGARADALAAEIRSLRETRSTTEGRGSGIASLAGWIVSGVLLAVALLTVVLRFSQ